MSNNIKEILKYWIILKLILCGDATFGLWFTVLLTKVLKQVKIRGKIDE